MSDDRGLVAVSGAGERSRKAVPCSDAAGFTPAGLAKRFEYCIVQYWALRKRRDYPATLDVMRKALPGCLERDAREGYARAMERGSPGGASEWLRYSAMPAGAAEPNYWLYLKCGGMTAFAILDRRGVILNADAVEARVWLNQCQEADDIDVPALARSAGLLLPAEFRNETRSARLPGAMPPREREFPGEPDLDARRAECRVQARDCFGLGNELERAIYRAGGNPARESELADAHREWLREARAAHVRACKAGEPRACAMAGSLATDALDHSARDVEELYSQGCAGRYAYSCTKLAEVYRSGMQSTRPGIRSVRLMGQPEMKLTEGVTDPARPAVAKDLARAAEYYQRACELGDRDSCREAAATLQESVANPADPAWIRANDIFARLCRGGEPGSCFSLIRNAADTGAIAGESTEYWRAQACLLAGDSYCVAPGN